MILHGAPTERRCWILAAALFALLLAFMPVRGFAQDTAYPAPASPGAAALADYAAALAAALAALDAAATDSQGLAAARLHLVDLDAFILPNGDVVTAQDILGDADSPLTRADAHARLRTALAQLATAAGDQTASRLAALDQVWLQPEFTRGETLGERLARWLAEFLDRLFPDWEPTPAAQRATLGATELAGWGIAGVAALVLAWVLSLWLRRLLGRFVADAALADDGNGDETQPRTPAEARERADALARTGAYRDAVRNLYLAALLTLERRRLVVADRSLTNREVLAQVPAENSIRPYLRPVVDTFDAVWYGIQEPDAAAFAGYAEQIDGLEQAATNASEATSA